MLCLLLLLLVGTTFAQESGDDDTLMEPADVEGDNFEEWNEKDLCLPEGNDQLEPDFSEKAEASKCPDKGTCGYHVFLRPRSFICAWFVCRFRRGYLSSIHGCCANNFLARVLKRNVTNSSYVWIGVIKRTRWSRYRNVDGTHLNYTNWAYRQPRGGGRWCVAMNRFTGRWVSLSCLRKLPFVCTY